MTAPALANISFAAAILCGLISAHLLMHVSGYRPWPNRLLGAYFAAFGTQQFLLSIQLTAEGLQLGEYRIALMLGANAVAYFFFWSFRHPEKSPLRTLHLVHFAPIGAVPILMASGMANWLDPLLSASLLGYAFYFGWMAKGGSHQFQALGTFQKDAYRWLIAFSGFFAFSAILDLVIAMQILNGGALINSIALMVVGPSLLVVVSFLALGSMGMQSTFSWLYEYGFLKNPAGRERGDISEGLATRIVEEIQKPRNFEDSNLTISRFAKRLGVPARHISIAINEQLDCTFSQLLNRTRIAAAEEMLVDDEMLQQTVLEIAYKVGFGSKSNFNKEFKRITGLTPTEYRTKARG